MIYEYKCKKCGKEQEQLVKMGGKPTEPCAKCGASPADLKRLLSAHAAMKMSWSKWSI